MNDELLIAVSKETDSHQALMKLVKGLAPKTTPDDAEKYAAAVLANTPDDPNKFGAPAETHN